MIITIYSVQEPITVTLGSERVYTQTGAKRRLSEVNDTFQYVPLLESLQSLLRNSEILDEVGSNLWLLKINEVCVCNTVTRYFNLVSEQTILLQIIVMVCC